MFRNHDARVTSGYLRSQHRDGTTRRTVTRAAVGYIPRPAGAKPEVAKPEVAKPDVVVSGGTVKGKRAFPLPHQ